VPKTIFDAMLVDRPSASRVTGPASICTVMPSCSASGRCETSSSSTMLALVSS
jgi:hypothetical protein